MHHSKKVGILPVEGSSDETKQTNEIGTFIPLLENINIQGKDITADALLTQRNWHPSWQVAKHITTNAAT